jgi:LysM repeat protein
VPAYKGDVQSAREDAGSVRETAGQKGREKAVREWNGKEWRMDMSAMLWRMRVALAALVGVVLISGCITLPEEARAREAERAAEDARRQKVLSDLRADLDQMRERGKTIEVAQENLARQIDALNKASARDQRTMQDKVAALDRAIRQMEADRARLQQQIVDDLSGKMAELIKSQPVPPPVPPKTTAGYEHVVKVGETLSLIAAAYKVKAQAIIEANNITNPNTVRPGQKLFIPEEPSAR